MNRLSSGVWFTGVIKYDGKRFWVKLGRRQVNWLLQFDPVDTLDHYDVDVLNRQLLVLYCSAACSPTEVPFFPL